MMPSVTAKISSMWSSASCFSIFAMVGVVAPRSAMKRRTRSDLGTLDERNGDPVNAVVEAEGKVLEIRSVTAETASVPSG